MEYIPHFQLLKYINTSSSWVPCSKHAMPVYQEYTPHHSLLSIQQADILRGMGREDGPRESPSNALSLSYGNP